MIDNFALGLTHGLLLLTAWRLLSRPDLDDSSAAEPAPAPKPERGFGLKQAKPD
ncbi:MAG TPA: hypothetical protein VF631_05590 [Allosphingosinicella sp.]|jgi:hypothetical protein|uniref:hypothetical protein n=1 Tax=Allosphingosinicella sp. TaxID=2823234 RepID=UPI002F29BECC